MNWISVKDLLPGKESDWVIVRCINSDEEVFYFMAIYLCMKGYWYIFDNVYNEEMQITHWCVPDEIQDEDKFIREEKI